MSEQTVASQRGISLREAWIRIGIKKTKLYELLKAGEIESYHAGTRHLVVLESVDAWIDRQRSRAKEA